MTNTPAVRIYRISSTILLASRPVPGRARKRAWVLASRQGDSWRAFHDAGSYERMLEAATHGNAVARRALPAALLYTIDEYEAEAVDWSQIHAALGTQRTLWVASRRGPGSIEAAMPFLPFADAVEAAVAHGLDYAAHELCAGKTPTQLLPLLSSAHAAARLAAQIALGIPS